MRLRAFRATMASLAPQIDLERAEAGLSILEDGLMVIDAEGQILRVGPYEEQAAEGLELTDFRGRWILPGFIDLHIHFPQVFCRDAYGGGVLLDWLERAVFPVEARLADRPFARRAANAFTSALAKAGTSTALIFGSQFEVAQAELVQALETRGLRAILGRTAMLQGSGAAAPLIRTLSETIALAEAEIRDYHPRDPVRARRGVALIPRFALSFTKEGLKAYGELYAKARETGVWFTTHISENDDPENGEVRAVRETFGVPHYLDTYDGRFLPGGARGGESFLGPRSVFAHGVHLQDAELERLAASRSSIAHCPVSQGFLGSGHLPLARTRRFGVEVGLGSDIGAGDRFCMAEVANMAFKVHMNAPERVALGPGALLHLLTLSGARALDLEADLGHLSPRAQADFVVLDPSQDPTLSEQWAALSPGPYERLFSLLMATTPALVTALYVQGREVQTDDLAHAD